MTTGEGGDGARRGGAAAQGAANRKNHTALCIKQLKFPNAGEKKFGGCEFFI
jgi:hypothetical protein